MTKTLTGIRSLLSNFVSRYWPANSEGSATEYPDYETALNATDTYEDPDVVEVVARKTEIFRERLKAESPGTIRSRQAAQNLFVFSLPGPMRPIEVMELGGACGAAFFELDHVMPGRILRWSIIETPAMAAAGARLFGSERLFFFDSVSPAVSNIRERDFLVAQGSLQYCPDPLRTLEDLLALEFNNVYITRTVVGVNWPATQTSPIVTMQNTKLSAHGPGLIPPGMIDRTSSQPLTIVSREMLMAAITRKYRVRLYFEESDPVKKRVAQRDIWLQDMGLLLTRA